MRIAILEDDPGHAGIIGKAMEEAGHECFMFDDGRVMLRDLHRGSYDLFILDWHVPHVEGPEILGWIRRNLGVGLPVVFVTSRDDEADIIEGLASGADDYMVKPVRAQELKARVHALLRRAYPDSDRRALTVFGAYQFDLHRKEIQLHGVAVTLKPKEYELALFLFRNVGRLLSRDHIMAELWGVGDVDSRTVVTHMSQLRRKLDLRPENGFRLSPVYSLGYRFEQLDSPAKGSA